VRHEPTSGYEDASLNYRVTWRSVDSGEPHEEVFTSRDQGWDFYQDMQRSAHAYGATWGAHSGVSHSLLSGSS
jgi:hypothetical protein